MAASSQKQSSRPGHLGIFPSQSAHHVERVYGKFFMPRVSLDHWISKEKTAAAG
ncbi:hypothetical protein [Saccharophagus sp. K07]|uniref:hypothetical protein n=1 Tax=Saccharophagus sp. K07 TaxID=2283636 RepID=UPI001652B4B2|nr:hypothetical protein [Saccharophagus sp. K07]